jgi:hypothetical protein
VGTLFFLFFAITTVVYRTDFAGGQVKATQADADAKAIINIIGTVGAATQLMVASIFGMMISARAQLSCFAVQSTGACGLHRVLTHNLFSRAVLLVYGLAPVSGGHINPAVSFGLMLTKKITVIRAMAYIVAQARSVLCCSLQASQPLTLSLCMPNSPAAPSWARWRRPTCRTKPTRRPAVA